MLWLVLSAAYRVQFRDLMDSVGVNGGTILKWIFNKYDGGGGGRER
jgi:hypothetical protein